ncbi:helix-turn-helix domain-containing protein [Maribellus luteus]|uniref:histidine kinase n=1 Tax=Maribellus luteus TaxID=2305463 RepID=A0A399TA57_9BACT|nr:hybrid sensor histidine kinase/response regulator transcription factor [Maribellus luteus]RIJ50853.1 helix-turn-helix domain-containing protein [Maribellus luteus]
MKRRILTLFVFLFTGFLPLCAQVNFTHITIEDGLSQSSVKCIFQDSKGFMWFGTADGLNKYDGYDFITYNNNPDDKFSIGGNDVSCVYENSLDSILWIGTQDGGLNRYDRKLDRFISFQISSKQLHRIPSNHIRDILVSRDSILWIASFNGGIFSFNLADTTFYQPEFSKSPAFVNTNCIKEDKTGTIWLGTTQGLFKWKLNDRKKGLEPQKVKFDSTNMPGNVRALLIDYSGQIWIGTNARGLYVYHPVSGEFKKYLASDDLSIMPSNQIRSLMQSRNGDIWAGTLNGLVKFDGRSSETTTYRNREDNPNSLNNNIVYSLFEDRSGILWAGTYLGGINKYDPLQARFPVFRNIVKGYSSRINDTRSITVDDRGNLWVGTTEGLIQINEKDLKEGKLNGRVHFEYQSVFEVVSLPGVGMMVSTSNGIYLENASGKFMNLSPDIDKQTGENIISFYTSCSSSDEEVWLAAGQGLLCFRSQDRRFSYYAPTGPDGERISLAGLALLEDFTDKIWIGTLNGELYSFDKHTHEFERTRIDNEMASFTKIFSLCQIKPGELWMGTNRGLYQLNMETLAIKRFLTSEGLSNNVVYTVLSDDNGNLWTSTNKGVSCYHTREGYFQNYTQKDGLQSNEFNQNAYFKAANGTIYLGGIDGLNIFHPKDVMVNEFVPPVIITDMEIQYQRISPAQNPDLLNEQISETKEVKLSYKKNTFSFEYTALSYSLPERNHYDYCLTPEGERDNWIEAGNRRFATFTNIDPGTYSFKVKGSNSDGIWNEEPAYVRIIIRPPYWQTWWFRIIMTSTLLIFVYLFFYLRLRAVQLQKVTLKKRVEEKTQRLLEQKDRIEEQNRELVILNEDMKHKNKLLNSQNKQISLQRDNLVLMADQLKENNQAKIQFYTTLSHELKTPLTLILEPIKEILQKTDRLSKGEIIKKLSIVQKNAARLFITVNQILDFRKAEINKMELSVSKFDLVAFVRESASFFNDLASKGKYDYVLHAKAENIKIWADRDKLEKVIFNLLSNAFKYTPEGGSIGIRIELKKDDPKTALVCIEDSGAGIPEENLSGIFERFTQAHGVRVSNMASSGLGLAIAKKYIELHKGSIQVNSELGIGTNFTIELPLTRGHFDADVKFVDEFVSDKEVLISSIGSLQKQVSSGVETSEDRQKPLMLLIEEDVELLVYLKEYLTQDFRIEGVNDLLKGEKFLNEKHPEIVICDLPTDEKSALDFCRRVKNEFNTLHIPFILITSGSSTDTNIEGLSAGCDILIVKPIDMQILLFSATNLIEGRKRLRKKFDALEIIPEGKDVSSANDQSFLDEAIRLVEANLDNTNFNVEMLCKELNLSQPQVYRKIKALTKLNITEFIRNIRLKKAAQLLRTGTLKVNEVAYETGFNDPNYFTKIFTKIYGMTPTDYWKSF